ncbi:unnamed protein product [Didymodactylos carnosus]|uniref:Uncharacterized protein n=1 Tax=Didymodactylos carnosus TaxID=1234261 RepID=A0A815BKF4_9BILA|nr:unnamed protein product [Didymodactylos carnosus]CAF4064082.1 unnamed protein product [Didymodactylos carnosus]
MTRYELSNFIKTKIPDVKLTDIQSNRNGTLTKFASDVYSYNKILLELAKHKYDNANYVKVYTSRSTEKVTQTDKQAFLKNVDVEIAIQEIEAALKSSEFDIDTVERLKNYKKDGDGTTCNAQNQQIKCKNYNGQHLVTFLPSTFSSSMPQNAHCDVEFAIEEEENDSTNIDDNKDNDDEKSIELDEPSTSTTTNYDITAASLHETNLHQKQTHIIKF